MSTVITVQDLVLVGKDFALLREWYKTLGDPFYYYVRQKESNGVWVWYNSDLNGEPKLHQKVDMDTFRFRVVLE